MEKKMMLSNETVELPGEARGLSALLCQREDAGQSMIEFALCLPLLMLVVTGILTFGLALNNYISLTEATSVGARQLAILRGQPGDPCSITAATIAAAAPLMKNTGSTTGLGYTFQVYTTATTSQTYTSTTCSTAPLTQGQPVTVTMTYPCVLKVFNANYVPSCTLKARTTEVVQ